MDRVARQHDTGGTTEREHGRDEEDDRLDGHPLWPFSGGRMPKPSSADQLTFPS